MGGHMKWMRDHGTHLEHFNRQRLNKETVTYDDKHENHVDKHMGVHAPTALPASRLHGHADT